MWVWNNLRGRVFSVSLSVEIVSFFSIGGYLLDDTVCFGPYCAKNSITVITDQYAFDGSFNNTSDFFTGILVW